MSQRKKKAKPAGRSGKDSKAFWKPRLRQRGKGPEWSARFYRGSKDVWINLGLSNRDAAANLAAKLYRDIQQDGWEAALDALKPNRKARDELTVGDFLASAEKVLQKQVAPRTARRYLQNFRVLARDICGISSSKERFRKGYGSKAFRDQVESQALAKITPAKINAWMTGRLSEAEGDKEREQKIRCSVNTYVLSGKALFSAKVLKGLDGIEVPASPFEGVQLLKHSPVGYRSKVKIELLIQQAMRELRPEWPDSSDRSLEAKDKRDRHEQFKCFLLGVFCGLRTGEVDLLLWKQVDFSEGLIHVETNEFFTPKSRCSARSILMDPEALEFLREYFGRAKSEFVIESNATWKKTRTDQQYRCRRHFRSLGAWLRTKGVEERNAVYALRKEFCTALADKAGIHVASIALGHKDISVTARHYDDKSRKVAIGLGGLLTGQNIQEAKAKEASNG